ncbi:MAG: hypothetical protein R6W96_05250 [Clostridia bacterium]
MAGKSLITYYSWIGNTEVVAREIQRQTGFDMERIEEVVERDPGKLMNAGRAAFFGMKSKLKPSAINPEDYENVFLGLQIWAGKSSPAINGYLGRANLKGKKVWLFITKSDEKVPLKAISSLTRRVEKKGGRVMGVLPVTTLFVWGKQLVISSDAVKEDVSQWLETIQSNL